MRFGAPDITDSEELAVREVLRSGWLGNGPIAAQFEKEFAAHLGVKHVVAVNSATMGLMLALRTVRFGRVITTPLTFAATLNAIIAANHHPVLCDVLEDGNIDPKLIRHATFAVSAVVPVHYTGTPARMDEIMEMADEYGWNVIEDAAHAFGGFWDDAKTQSLGTIGDFGVFSLYPTKNITAGDGGMVVCRTEEDALKVRILANQGQTRNAWNRYGSKKTRDGELLYPGYKGAMPDLNAAIGRVQLARWPSIKARRDKVWAIYEKAFGKRPRGHSKHLFTIRRKDRDKVRERLKKQGIPTGIHYTPLHLEPAYKFLGYKLGDFPMAEKIGRETLSLPVSATMTEDDARKVVNAL